MQPLFANRTAQPGFTQQPYNPICVRPTADRADTRRFCRSHVYYRT
jgi:hypothetical protein